MLALSALGATVTAILYVLSFAAFVMAAVGWSHARLSNLVAIGLALYVFVQAWNAVAAA
ncbi:MAG: hypothetical protein WD598_12690 [Acidimicrobiia bacterium]